MAIITNIWLGKIWSCLNPLSVINCSTRRMNVFNSSRKRIFIASPAYINFWKSFVLLWMPFIKHLMWVKSIKYQHTTKRKIWKNWTWVQLNIFYVICSNSQHVIIVQYWSIYRWDFHIFFSTFFSVYLFVYQLQLYTYESWSNIANIKW